MISRQFINRAEEILYSPSNLTYWDVVPNNVKVALDNLVFRVKTLEDATTTINLNDINDVSLSSLVNQQVLTYNSVSQTWVNQSVSNIAHTHVSNDITDFSESVYNDIVDFLVEGQNIDFTYDEVNNTITITSRPLAVLEGLTKAVTVESPSGSEDISLFYTDVAIIIRKITAVLRGSSKPKVTWTIRHSTDRSLTGNEVITGGTLTQSTTTGDVIISFNDSTIPANSFIWLETTLKSGTVDELHISIKYDED